MKHLIPLAAFALFAAGAAQAEPKMCPHLVSPVCALKGETRTTYNNSCEAERDGAGVLHDGACEGGDMCSMIYKPVCAVDPKTRQEKTYSSICVSEHDNARILRDGECKAP
jgi:hypothetical protein